MLSNLQQRAILLSFHMLSLSSRISRSRVVMLSDFHFMQFNGKLPIVRRSILDNWSSHNPYVLPTCLHA